MCQRGTDDSGSSVLGERVGVLGSKSRTVLLWMVASAGKESPLLSHGPTHVAPDGAGLQRADLFILTKKLAQIDGRRSLVVAQKWGSRLPKRASC